MTATGPRIITRPIGAWTDPVTTDRSRSPFKASWADTLDLLGFETDKLGASLVVLQIAITEDDLRRDGLIRANARVGFPGVRVAFESDRGPLMFATDAYDWWQGNIRAIALGLEALRKLDRYGITKRGEQYVGWQALAASANTAMDRTEAAALLAVDTRWTPAQLLQDRAAVQLAHRQHARRHHPDVGGDGGLFARLNVARDILLATEG